MVPRLYLNVIVTSHENARRGGMTTKSSPYPNNAYLDPRLEAELITRLNRAQGHLGSINRMITNHEDCTQILTQLTAVQAALHQITLKLLDDHIESCVSACVEDGTSRGYEAIGDLKRVVAMLLK